MGLHWAIYADAAACRLHCDGVRRESSQRATDFRAAFHRRNFAAAITIPVTKVERASKQQKIGNEPGHDTLPTLRPPPRAPGFRPLLQRGGKSTAACLNLGAPMPHEQMVPAIHSGRGTGSIDRLKPLDWHVVVGRDGVVSLRPSSGGCGGTGQTPQNIKT